MTDRLFGFYDDWKNEPLTCPACGWTGTFEQGDIEYYDELMDSSCPKCAGSHSPTLAIVSYPTMEETAANWDNLSESEKQEHRERREFLDRLNAQQLRGPKQLRNLEGETLTLTWDFVTNENDERRNVIRCGNRVVWDEPAVYEAYDRFEEVAKILKAKYGHRLLDLEPTEASWAYLLGDSLSASSKIEQVRRRLGNDAL